MENNTPDIPVYDPNAIRPYIVISPKACQRVEVNATSSYAAQQEGARLLKVKPNKAYLCSVFLADVVHNPSTLGS